MNKTFFISGIGTEIGKTVTAAVLTEAWQADYWKPVQAGDLDNSDTMKVEKWTSNPKSKFHTEQFRLNHPMSPHAAADLDEVEIKLTDFQLPETENTLLIEGAGGLMVPINHKECIIDVIKHLKIPVILVSQIYLGNINHTLLSINALRNADIPIHGVIFNGKQNKATEAVIEKMGNIQILGRIEQMEEVNAENVKKAAQIFQAL